MQFMVGSFLSQAFVPVSPGHVDAEEITCLGNLSPLNQDGPRLCEVRFV